MENTMEHVIEIALTAVLVILEVAMYLLLLRWKREEDQRIAEPPKDIDPVTEVRIRVAAACAVYAERSKYGAVTFGEALAISAACGLTAPIGSGTVYPNQQLARDRVRGIGG